MILVFKTVVWCSRGSSFWKASHLFSVVRDHRDWPSSHLGLKVRTFLNSPGNADFENDLILNPSFNIRGEKAKTVKPMTRAPQSEFVPVSTMFVLKCACQNA